jgi:hypothetical protein
MWEYQYRSPSTHAHYRDTGWKYVIICSIPSEAIGVQEVGADTSVNNTPLYRLKKVKQSRYRPGVAQRVPGS